MSYDSDRAALEGAFYQGWGNRTPVAYADQAFTPSNGQQWVRFTVKTTGSARTTVYPLEERTSGAAFIQCFAPSPGGSANARRLADAAATIFRGSQYGNLICRDTTVTDVGTDGVFYQFNVSVAYTRDGL